MTDPHHAVEAVFRIESPRLIGGLVRMVRDVGQAEELAQEALVAALEQWPRDGVPDNPGAWLMAAAKHRALDQLRRARMLDRKHEELGREVREDVTPDLEARLDEDVGDDLLRLVLAACHPALSVEARVALTLRLLGGLTVEEIARAYLAPAPTIAQRIVRAKKTLAEKEAAFEVPRGEALRERIPAVLEVIYLIFNEGYSATAGEDWLRPALCEDALRLARVMQGLVPDAPEVHGLASLLEIQASRIRARTGRDGAPVPLLDQDRSRWDGMSIARGLAALRRAEELGGAEGPYALQAAIAACHARARRFEDTDWARMAALYGVLARVTPSPIVELNRAVAVSYAEGPAAGLAVLDAVQDHAALRGYHHLPSVRGDLLLKLGRRAEARAELERAAGLTENEAERRLLRERAEGC